MNQLTKYKAIFFDFDGVIMDSMSLKLESFIYALEEYNFTRQQIQKIQQSMAGLSRFKILNQCVKELARENLNEDQLRKLSDRFSEHDLLQVKNIKMIDGSLEFIQQYHHLFYTAIITGTPQQNIEHTMKVHHLDKYFNSIDGSPELKTDIMRRLIKQHNLKLNEVVMIGDGATDQNAALEVGIDFIGMQSDGYSFDRNKCTLVISNLIAL